MRVTITTVGTLFGGLVLYVGVTNLLGIVGKEPWMSIALFSSFITAGLVSWRIARRLFPPPKYPTVEELEKQGLIEVREFSARRAFQVYEFEDEGPAYFVELEDGRVLYLCGQYLDDVEGITDDPESSQPALFPCAQFRLRTRKDTGWGIGVEPLSPFFGLDAEFPPFTQKDFKAGWIPSDGQILSESYDALKERLASRE